MRALRQLVLIAGLVLVLPGFLSCSKEQAIFFDIPEASASEALNAFSSQTSLEIIYNAEEVGPVSTNRVYGKMTRDEALRLLFKGTSLDYSMDEKSGAIAVWRKKGITRN